MTAVCLADSETETLARKNKNRKLGEAAGVTENELDCGCSNLLAGIPDSVILNESLTSLGLPSKVAVRIK